MNNLRLAEVLAVSSCRSSSKVWSGLAANQGEPVRWDCKGVVPVIQSIVRDTKGQPGSLTLKLFSELQN